ncbi:Protein of unknown function [Virgibacillus subterraneus]|uniref:DUF2624 domain-containing protein n=2 Tax=Virgibacillus TaxID=84406 RepID=A0A1H1BC14_9BACI|nr:MULTISPECIES: DUF2624 family protein [Virgibacillus]SDQ49459.1 Protein of unknown function [Virgibacillus salinus]SEQ18402.1 Protein of unknown function [Virgibacillus subterraneus]
MSKFIKDLAIKKMKQLSTEELLHYSKQNGVIITRLQAQQIISYLQNHSVDPFDDQGRHKMLIELSRITDRETAKKSEKLFHELIKAYGLEHLFN